MKWLRTDDGRLVHLDRMLRVHRQWAGTTGGQDHHEVKAVSTDDDDIDDAVLYSGTRAECEAFLVTLALALGAWIVQPHAALPFNDHRTQTEGRDAS
jgi:hypothetical protein